MSLLSFGKILLQRQENNFFAPVAYFSKPTSDVERRSQSYELETLVIVNVIGLLHVYLQDINFKIITDYNASVLAFRKIDINSRIAR